MPNADAVNTIASDVFEAAKKTGYALMVANYTERDAWELPGGKIRGLEAPARDISAALRDSIWARFDSLRFHHTLMASLRTNDRRRAAERGAKLADFDYVWSATWHSQYLFDDIVFNAASFFDYLGNAIWFGFHGQNHIKKKWNRASDAARKPEVESGLPRGVLIFGSKTAEEVRRIHDTLVNELYGYRSELIHNRMDAPDIYSHEFWETNQRSGARFALPKKFEKRLMRVISGAEEASGPIDMVDGAERLICRVGREAVGLLQALRDDLGWSEGEPLTMLS